MIDYFIPEPVVLAHRGDSAHFPENTMPAFNSAVKMEVDVIETDVHLTLDGEVIVWHDNSLEKMSGDKRIISSLTWAEIKKVDAGYLFTTDNGKTYPFRNKNISAVRLRDLLKEYPKMKFNIDLKDNNLILAEKYAQILKDLNCIERIVTASFHSNVLKHFRKLLPRAITSCTSLEVIVLILFYHLKILFIPLPYKMRIVQVPEFSGKIRVISKGFIKVLHKRGFKVQIWTINNQQEMYRLLQMEVDGIFTDKPTLLMECVKKSKF